MRFHLSAVLLTAGLIAGTGAQAQQNLDLSDGFIDYTGWTLLGSASAHNMTPGNGWSYSILELTSPGVQGQAGAAFAPQAWALDVDQAFHVDFHFYVNPGSTLRGDGMSFTLSTATGLGNGGSGLGYEGLDHSVALAIDTFNFDGEPISPSLQILQNGSVTPLAVTETGIGDGLYNVSSQWRVQLDWAPSGLGDHMGLLSGTLSQADQGSFAVQATLDLSDLAGMPLFYGFTAGTGLADDSYAVSSAMPVPEPANSALMLAGLAALIGLKKRRAIRQP